MKTHQSLLNTEMFQTLSLHMLIRICLIVITPETASVLQCGQGFNRDPLQLELWVALVYAKLWHGNEALSLLYFQLFILVIELLFQTI